MYTPEKLHSFFKMPEPEQIRLVGYPCKSRPYHTFISVGGIVEYTPETWEILRKDYYSDRVWNQLEMIHIALTQMWRCDPNDHLVQVYFVHLFQQHVHDAVGEEDLFAIALSARYVLPHVLFDQPPNLNDRLTVLASVFCFAAELVRENERDIFFEVCLWVAESLWVGRYHQPHRPLYHQHHQWLPKHWMIACFACLPLLNHECWNCVNAWCGGECLRQQAQKLPFYRVIPLPSSKQARDEPLLNPNMSHKDVLGK